MRYPAEEKLAIIKLVEQSNIPAKQALDGLGMPRTTFYRWYDQSKMVPTFEQEWYTRQDSNGLPFSNNPCQVSSIQMAR